MWATRYQFPIGQGCFHAGSLGLADSEPGKFHYVYDCGSRNQDVLQNSIDWYKTLTSYIRALFVSHFDIDHVSGLDRLLATVKVETVYIPYVAQSVLLLDLIEAEMNGALSASLIEATMEPASWFGRRGVHRVVRIRESGGPPPDRQFDTGTINNNDDPPEDVQRAPEPATDEYMAGERKLSQDHLSKSRERLTATEQPPPHRRRRGKTGERSELLSAQAGFKIEISASHRTSGWLLLPHVHPAPKEQHKAFRRRMRKSLGLRRYQPLTPAILTDALRDRKRREALRECYEEIISKGSNRNHNRISMSLYSGPMASDPKQTWEYWLERCLPWEGEFYSVLFRHERKAVGWLGTGDASLKMKEVRKRWQEAYQPVKDQIFSMLLPHHGSYRNFHEELLQYPELELCIASAGDPSQYGHPSGEVVGAILKYGKKFFHVSEHFHSGFIEKMSLV